MLDGLLKNLIYFIQELGKGFSLDIVLIFTKEAIGKIQVTKRLKSKELGTSDSETLYYMLLVVLSPRLVDHSILRRLDNRVFI